MKTSAQKPLLVTATRHPDYIRVIQSADFFRSFTAATLMLDRQPDIRGIVWIPERTSMRTPLLDDVEHGEYSHICFAVADDEREALEKERAIRTYDFQADLYTVVSTTRLDRAGDISAHPHLDGVTYDSHMGWTYAQPESRRCVHTFYGEGERSGTIFYDAVPVTDMLSKSQRLGDYGDVRESAYDQLGQAWQLSAGSALFMRTGGAAETQLFHAATRMRLATDPFKPERVTRVVHSYDYCTPFKIA